MCLCMSIKKSLSISVYEYVNECVCLSMYISTNISMCVKCVWVYVLAGVWILYEYVYEYLYEYLYELYEYVYMYE